MTMPDPRTGQSRSSSGVPLTVIMPAYNEESGIRAAVKEVQEEVLDKVPGANLLVVNDGSEDNTANILGELASNDSRIAVINQPNLGHGPSLIRAMNQASGERFFLIDSDMQIPLNCFGELWKLSNSVDAVFGVRSKRNDPPHRLFLSALTACVLGAIFKVKLPDSNSPFKILKREIWEDMNSKLGNERLLAPSIFLAIYANKHNYKVILVPVTHKARKTGLSSLNLVSLSRFGINGFRQIIEYKDRLS